MRCARRCSSTTPGALAAFGTDLASTDALAILAIAPTPELGRGLSRSKIVAALRKGGRQRSIERRADEIQRALRAEQLGAPALIAGAHGIIARSAVALITTFNAQIAELEAPLSEHFEQHPDAKDVLSLPGLGTVLGRSGAGRVR
jgi:transposase